ncbi:MAG: hypothetical protein EP329_20215 [Deltaproteobacteria bacterium]|nr:MAG: hypothetical protein EP329_20215 [Deltaproteobacteria bacterium]
MLRSIYVASTLLAAALLWSCDGAPAPGGDGPAVKIDVAALNLVGVGDAVWDIEVVNGATTPDVVWQRRLTSSGYGDGAGSASYVGPCDADPAAADNVVRVWVVGLYTGTVTDAGAFNTGLDTGVGAVTGTPMPFRNPTDAGPLTRTVTCREDADVAVQFDVALMRPAQQGFFDIAVNFNNIFCSAKFDCCEDTGATCDDIGLLFDETGGRARTVVLGFACTAGTGASATELYLDKLALDCTSPASGFSADLLISPGGDAGNLCTPGSLSACAAIADPGGVGADNYLFQAAVFRGEESLTSGGAQANKVYWNIALGVRAAISGCELRTRGTADDGADPADHVDGGTIEAGSVYPVIAWDVDLATCQAEQLDNSVMVASGYTGVADGATTFDYAWAPGALPVRTCPPGWLLIDDTCVDNVNLVTNGTFDADLAGWDGTLGSWNAAGTVSVSTSPGTGGLDYFRQTVTTIPGQTYELTFDVTALSGPAGIASYVFATNSTENPRNGVKLAPAAVTTTPTSGVTYTFVAQTTATNVVLATEVQVGNTTVDNVTLFIVP